MKKSAVKSVAGAGMTDQESRILAAATSASVKMYGTKNPERVAQDAVLVASAVLHAWKNR